MVLDILHTLTSFSAFQQISAIFHRELRVTSDKHSAVFCRFPLDVYVVL